MVLCLSFNNYLLELTYVIWLLCTYVLVQDSQKCTLDSFSLPELQKVIKCGRVTVIVPSSELSHNILLEKVFIILMNNNGQPTS